MSEAELERQEIRDLSHFDWVTVSTRGLCPYCTNENICKYHSKLKEFQELLSNPKRVSFIYHFIERSNQSPIKKMHITDCLKFKVKSGHECFIFKNKE